MPLAIYLKNKYTNITSFPFPQVVTMSFYIEMKQKKSLQHKNAKEEWHWFLIFGSRYCHRHFIAVNDFSCLTLVLKDFHHKLREKELCDSILNINQLKMQWNCTFNVNVRIRVALQWLQNWCKIGELNTKIANQISQQV